MIFFSAGSDEDIINDPCNTNFDDSFASERQEMSPSLFNIRRGTLMQLMMNVMLTVPSLNFDIISC